MFGLSFMFTLAENNNSYAYCVAARALQHVLPQMLRSQKRDIEVRTIERR